MAVRYLDKSFEIVLRMFNSTSIGEYIVLNNFNPNMNK